MVDAHLPVSYQSFPVFGFRNSIASHQFQEERLIEAILLVFLLQLVDERKPHLLIHSLKGSPVEHIICPMTFCPGTLALESHVMNAFHDELSHTIIEYLALDFAVHHLTHEFLHLFTSFRNRHFQGKEMNQIILQRVFLQIPRHGYASRIRNLHLPRLAEVVQHLQVILCFRQILVILVFHLIRYFYQIGKKLLIYYRKTKPSLSPSDILRRFLQHSPLWLRKGETCSILPFLPKPHSWIAPSHGPSSPESRHR